LASPVYAAVAALHALPMICKKDFVSLIASGHFALIINRSEIGRQIAME